MRKLSDNRDKPKYAYCEYCNEFFEDDVKYMTGLSVFCPNNCGYVVIRGITSSEIQNNSLNAGE